MEGHRLYVADRPHLYPLARLTDQYHSYAVLIADTNAARLFVFGRGATMRSGQVTGTNVSRSAGGGWSQARYQRHIENYHLHHAKELVEALEQVVRLARTTGAHIFFIEDPTLLADVGGVGAMLRYRL